MVGSFAARMAVILSSRNDERVVLEHAFRAQRYWCVHDVDLAGQRFDERLPLAPQRPLPVERVCDVFLSRQSGASSSSWKRRASSSFGGRHIAAACCCEGTIPAPDAVLPAFPRRYTPAERVIAVNPKLHSRTAATAPPPRRLAAVRIWSSESLIMRLPRDERGRRQTVCTAPAASCTLYAGEISAKRDHFGLDQRCIMDQAKRVVVHGRQITACVVIFVQQTDCTAARSPVFQVRRAKSFLTHDAERHQRPVVHHTGCRRAKFNMESASRMAPSANRAISVPHLRSTPSPLPQHPAMAKCPPRRCSGNQTADSARMVAGTLYGSVVAGMNRDVLRRLLRVFEQRIERTDGRAIFSSMNTRLRTCAGVWRVSSREVAVLSTPLLDAASISVASSTEPSRMPRHAPHCTDRRSPDARS